MSQFGSPLIFRASWMSRGCTVTCLAWITKRFASSRTPIRYASAPSWRASSAFFCHLRGHTFLWPSPSSSSVRSGAVTCLLSLTHWNSRYVISRTSLKQSGICNTVWHDRQYLILYFTVHCSMFDIFDIHTTGRVLVEWAGLLSRCNFWLLAVPGSLVSNVFSCLNPVALELACSSAPSLGF